MIKRIKKITIFLLIINYIKTTELLMVEDKFVEDKFVENKVVLWVSLFLVLLVLVSYGTYYYNSRNNQNTANINFPSSGDNPTLIIPSYLEYIKNHKRNLIKLLNLDQTIKEEDLIQTMAQLLDIEINNFKMLLEVNNFIAKHKEQLKQIFFNNNKNNKTTYEKKEQLNQDILKKNIAEQTTTEEFLNDYCQTRYNPIFLYFIKRINSIKRSQTTELEKSIYRLIMSSPLQNFTLKDYRFDDKEVFLKSKLEKLEEIRKLQRKENLIEIIKKNNLRMKLLTYLLNGNFIGNEFVNANHMSFILNNRDGFTQVLQLGITNKINDNIFDKHYFIFGINDNQIIFKKKIDDNEGSIFINSTININTNSYNNLFELEDFQSLFTETKNLRENEFIQLKDLSIDLLRMITMINYNGQLMFKDCFCNYKGM